MNPSVIIIIIFEFNCYNQIMKESSFAKNTNLKPVSLKEQKFHDICDFNKK